MKFEEFYKKIFTDRDIQQDNPLVMAQNEDGHLSSIKEIKYDLESNTLILRIEEI